MKKSRTCPAIGIIIDYATKVVQNNTPGTRYIHASRCYFRRFFRLGRGPPSFFWKHFKRKLLLLYLYRVAHMPVPFLYSGMCINSEASTQHAIHVHHNNRLYGTEAPISFFVLSERLSPSLEEELCTRLSSHPKTDFGDEQNTPPPPRKINPTWWPRYTTEKQ